MSRGQTLAIAVAATWLLCACGGGGGGGGGGGNSFGGTPVSHGTPIPVDTSLSNLSASTQLAVTSERAIAITPGAVVSEVGASTAVSLRTTNGVPQEVVVTVPAYNVAARFTVADLPLEVWRSGSNFQTVLAGASVSGGTFAVSLFAPLGGLQYNTLGGWILTPQGPASITLDFFVAGSPTVGAAIPTTGTATYQGAMDAILVALNVFDNVDALATAQADFAARTVTLSTTATQRTSVIIPGATTIPAGQLDIQPSVLTYQPADNALTGTLTTANGMTGTTTATFFGPGAAELGGTFRVQDAGGSTHMIGGYSLSR